MTTLCLQARRHIGHMPYVPGAKGHDFCDRDGRRGAAAVGSWVAVYSAIETVSESILFQLPPDLLCMITSTSVASGEGTLAISSL